MTESVYQTVSGVLSLNFDCSQVLQIEGFTGSGSQMRGSVELTVTLPYDMKTKTHSFAVVDNALIPHCVLLGIDFMVACSLAICGATDLIIQDRPSRRSGKLLPYRQVPRVPYIVSYSAADSERTNIEETTSVIWPSGAVSLLSEEAVMRSQDSDPNVSKLVEAIVMRIRPEDWPDALVDFKHPMRKYVSVGGVLMCKVNGCDVVVDGFKLLGSVAVAVHRELAHIGRDKLFYLLRRRIYHPKLYMVVKDVCSSCPECQLTKVSRQVHYPPTLKIITQCPFELVAADIVTFPTTSDGFVGCLMVVDHNSKWLSAVPIRNKTSKTVANAFHRQVLPFLPGIPSRILTDNGSEFVGAEFNTMLEKFGIQHVYSTPYRPQSNGCIERVNRTIGDFLRRLRATQNWADDLVTAVITYNNTLHSTIGLSPVAYLMERPHTSAESPAISSSVKDYWRTGHSKFRPYVPGQLVVRQLPIKGHNASNKFKAKCDGPYRVAEVGPNGLTYKILTRNDGKAIRAHHNQLMPWVDIPEYLHSYYEDMGVQPTLEGEQTEADDVIGATLLLSSSEESSDSESDCNQPPIRRYSKRIKDINLSRPNFSGKCDTNPSGLNRECGSRDVVSPQLALELADCSGSPSALNFSGFTPEHDVSVMPRQLPNGGLTHSHLEPQCEAHREILSSNGNTGIYVPNRDGQSSHNVSRDPLKLHNSNHSISTPSSCDEPRSFSQLRSQVAEIGKSLDQRLSRYAESRESVNSQWDSVKSSPSVSKRTPIINSAILNRAHTRSRGPVASHPYVLSTPLERLSKAKRSLSSWANK